MASHFRSWAASCNRPIGHCMFCRRKKTQLRISSTCPPSPSSLGRVGKLADMVLTSAEMLWRLQKERPHLADEGSRPPLLRIESKGSKKPAEPSLHEPYRSGTGFGLSESTKP